MWVFSGCRSCLGRWESRRHFGPHLRQREWKPKSAWDVSGRNQVVRLINSSYVREDCCRSEPGKAGRGLSLAVCHVNLDFIKKAVGSYCPYHSIRSNLIRSVCYYISLSTIGRVNWKERLEAEKQYSEASINLALFTCVPSILWGKKITSSVSLYLLLHTHHMPKLACWMHICTKGLINQMC